MANCNSCGKDVGFGCNLTNGKCLGCISKDGAETQMTLAPDRRRARYTAPKKEAPPLIGFEEILKTPGLSKEEKIKRINDILEKARQTI